MSRLVALSLGMAVAAHAQSLEVQARAILAEKCLSCHGPARMSGLRLDSRAAILTGGTRGPGAIPGKASDSLLYRAVAREGKLQMPPGPNPLSPAQVETLRAWIDAGMPFADTPPAAPQPTWWSFVKPARGNVHSIDERMRPGPPADRRALIRRATFDLTGLPPDPKAVDAFVNDPDPQAYAKLLDRLLASPQYGERWGRLWLDVVRYADTGGYETDVLFPNAWRYRDYVIRSFNADKPYDVFIQEQIAADEIWPDNLELEGIYEMPESKRKSLERRMGTVLFTLGAMPVEYSFFGNQYRAEWQAECVNVAANAFLGLSMQCARCHDHKFDPISQRDYYRLSAMFAGSEDREVPIVSQMRIFEYTRFQTKVWALEELKKKYNSLDKNDKDGRETVLREMGEAYLKAPAMYDKANLLVHTAPVPDTYILPRGDSMQKGEVVKPGTPAVFGPGPEIAEPESPWFVPRRREALAKWIGSRDNPLTARVMVNRIWQGHFGKGLVSTPNDFGRQGDKPSDQALLDWLAIEFMENGWSVKHMHRLIMNSAFYQTRHDAVRLDAEEIRDSVLSASGSLNPKMYGQPVVSRLSADEREAMRDLSMWPVTADAKEHDRRSIYLFMKRSFRLPMLDTFDAPDTGESCPRREISTVAPQALALMNSEWIESQARRFAARIGKSEDAVGDAWRIALGRAPEADERTRATEFLARNGNELWRLCLLIFNMSEFLYVN